MPIIKVHTPKVVKSPKIMKSPVGIGLSIMIESKNIYPKKAQHNIIIIPENVGQMCGLDFVFIFNVC